MEVVKWVFVIGGCLYALCYLVFLLKTRKPFRNLLLQGGIGIFFLCLVEVASRWTGVSIGINPWTALTAGVTGIPGVLLLLFMRFIWAI